MYIAELEEALEKENLKDDDLVAVRVYLPVVIAKGLRFLSKRTRTESDYHILLALRFWFDAHKMKGNWTQYTYDFDPDPADCSDLIQLRVFGDDDT